MIIIAFSSLRYNNPRIFITSVMSNNVFINICLFVCLFICVLSHYLKIYWIFLFEYINIYLLVFVLKLIKYEIKQPRIKTTHCEHLDWGLVFIITYIIVSAITLTLTSYQWLCHQHLCCIRSNTIRNTYRKIILENI